MRARLLIALLLAGAWATTPTALAHTCEGADCGDCDFPGRHDHRWVERTGSDTETRQHCSSGWNTPGPGAPAIVATLVGLALALRATRA